MRPTTTGTTTLTALRGRARRPATAVVAAAALAGAVALSGCAEDADDGTVPEDLEEEIEDLDAPGTDF
ncbi:hypothetical protein [Aquipuribacter nitratireducens]|uniref:Uncharacterized protein n=1 Tax=Aquipuribacter nitratireducens TaxID=650104 RepID=A0ABW0GPX7_9MICO